MFDAVRNNRRIVQVFLILITVPFAVWGVDAYFRGDAGGVALATVGEATITANQFREELRQQQDRFRQQMPGVDATELNSPEMREAVLDDLVNRLLVAQEAKRQKIDVVAAMRMLIAQDPSFQENGAFSQKRYEEALAAQNMDPVVFESRLQEMLTRQFLLSAAGQAAFMPKTTTRQVVALQLETREAQENLISWKSLVGQVKVTDADAQQFYDANPPRFTTPERIRVEFVALEQDKLDSPQSVSDEELKAWYENHREQYAIKPEERRTSHVLLLTDKAGADKAKVKAEAEALLAEIRKDPSRFAELAKARSQDPGSAAQGGDIGFYPRNGALDENYSAAAFALKEGEISGLVESVYGFHIIRLTEIKPGQYKPYAEARKEVEAELKRQGAASQFVSAREGFADLVFQQADSLQPAAEKFGLKVQQSGWITRNNGGPLGNPQLMAAMFGDEMLKNGHNTEAVEIAPGIVVAARLLKHEPATLIPFAEVKTNIVSTLTQEKAQALAVERGAANLKALEADAKAVKIDWGKARTVSRQQPGDLEREALRAIFRVGADKLPGYAGVELPGVGYALYKVSKVTAGKITDEIVQGAGAELEQINAEAQVSAYMAALRQRYKVDINRNLLEDNKD
jgi:peptidyl-prolyl cis-trans isomerase D